MAIASKSVARACLLAVAVLVMMASGAGAAVPAADGTFSITGGPLTDLAPGVTKELLLTVSNPESFPLTVTELTVTVGDASAGCTGDNVTATAFTGALEVPANGTADQAVEVTMLGSAPDACQNATFPLTFGGEATGAGPSDDSGSGSVVSTLPFTGSMTDILLKAAGWLLAVGAVLAVATRYRRTRARGALS